MKNIPAALFVGLGIASAILAAFLAFQHITRKPVQGRVVITAHDPASPTIEVGNSCWDGTPCPEGYAITIQGVSPDATFGKNWPPALVRQYRDALMYMATGICPDGVKKFPCAKPRKRKAKDSCEIIDAGIACPPGIPIDGHCITEVPKDCMHKKAKDSGLVIAKKGSRYQEGETLYLHSCGPASSSDGTVQYWDCPAHQERTLSFPQASGCIGADYKTVMPCGSKGINPAEHIPPIDTIPGDTAGSAIGDRAGFPREWLDAKPSSNPTQRFQWVSPSHTSAVEVFYCGKDGKLHPKTPDTKEEDYGNQCNFIVEEQPK